MGLFRDCGQDATAEETKETLKRYEFSSRPAVSFGEFLKMSHDLETDPGLLKEGFFRYVDRAFAAVAQAAPQALGSNDVDSAGDSKRLDAHVDHTR